MREKAHCVCGDQLKPVARRIPATTMPIKPYRDINWKEFVPARPPENGLYLIVYLLEGKQEMAIVNFDKEDQSWTGRARVVTHYAKVEYPA
jgi:hypothetical protein